VLVVSIWGLIQGRRQRGGQWCSPPFEICSPNFIFAPCLIHTSNLEFKICPPCNFCFPLLRNPGDRHGLSPPKPPVATGLMSLQYTHVRSFGCRGRLRNWKADCFMVGLYCVTITWQQIFKGPLQIMAGALPHVAAERRHLVR